MKRIYLLLLSAVALVIWHQLTQKPKTFRVVMNLEEIASPFTIETRQVRAEKAWDKLFDFNEFGGITLKGQGDK